MPLAKVGLMARQGDLAQGHSNAAIQQRLNGIHLPVQNSQRSPVDDPRSHGDSTPDTAPEDYALRHANHTQSSAQRPPTNPADSLSNAKTTSSSSIVMVSRPESSGNDGIALPAMRHGFGEAYSSEEYLAMLEQVCLISISLS